MATVPYVHVLSPGTARKHRGQLQRVRTGGIDLGIVNSDSVVPGLCAKSVLYCPICLSAGACAMCLRAVPSVCGCLVCPLYLRAVPARCFCSRSAPPLRAVPALCVCVICLPSIYTCALCLPSVPAWCAFCLYLRDLPTLWLCLPGACVLCRLVMLHFFILPWPYLFFQFGFLFYTNASSEFEPVFKR